jgi:DNA-binding transcriptional LysR family regulator
VVLSFNTRTLADHAGEHMRGGELDLSVDWYPSEGDCFVLRKLYEDGYVVIARNAHSRVTTGIRKEKFVVTRYRGGTSPEAIRTLRQAIADLDLNVELHLSKLLETPFIVMKTDLIGFIPRSMVTPAVAAADLQVIGDAVPSLTIPLYLVSHETRRTDDRRRWLRELVAQTVVAAVGADVGRAWHLSEFLHAIGSAIARQCVTRRNDFPVVTPLEDTRWTGWVLMSPFHYLRSGGLQQENQP